LVSELDGIVRQYLPAYFAPEAYEYLESLPRTPSLKIARASVRAEFADRYEFT